MDHVNGDGNRERSRSPAVRGSRIFFAMLKDANVNGIRDDLQVLCANCHQAKDRYGGCSVEDHLAYVAAVSDVVIAPIGRDVTNSNREKIAWPTDAQLSRIVWAMPMTTVARRFGVSDTAVKKRCRARHILTPGRGYWSKHGAGDKT